MVNAGRFTRNEDRRRCDGGKVCLSRGDARRAAHMLNRRQQRDRWPVAEYLCPDCGWWHTGHQQTRNVRRPRA